MKPWKELQCGHYVSRSHLSLRYDERNCHPQCVGCNIFKSGAMDEYALALVRQYGDGILEELGREKQKIVKDFPYYEKLQFYKEATKTL